MNLFRAELERRLRRSQDVPLAERLQRAITIVNEAMLNRIRSAAIVDYYLKHINDIAQLKQLDLRVAQLIVGYVLDKPFRWRDFDTIPYGRLRALGLLSLRHRQRLHCHGHIKVSFLSIHNEIIHDRHLSMLKRRRERIDQMKISRKLRKP